MSLTDLAERRVLNFLFVTSSPSDPAMAAPSSYSLALYTSDPGEGATGGTEVSGGSYARVTIPNDGTGWTDAVTSSGTTTKSNAAEITFATATASWGTISHWVLWSNTGERVMSGAFVSAKSIDTGDRFLINAGDFVISGE